MRRTLLSGPIVSHCVTPGNSDWAACPGDVDVDDRAERTGRPPVLRYRPMVTCGGQNFQAEEQG